MIKNHIKQSFFDSLELSKRYFTEELFETVAAASELIAKQIKAGRKILVAGNGGSSCDSMHFAEELTGRYRKDRRALPAVSLTDPAYLTCVANDFGFANVFSRGVEALGKEGDIFIGISTSGNSENIVRAVDKARKMNIFTITLLGKDGGKLKGKGDFEFIVPGFTSDRIQEIHITVLHIIIEGTERILFPENYEDQKK
ncbi:MAG: phosphoheptose isomerase [Candidatus Cloacimonadota bacterium]|nr:MAG: phosphoheptose isomerase [Candidatus Cloacimonadota bacterium]